MCNSAIIKLSEREETKSKERYMKFKIERRIDAFAKLVVGKYKGNVKGKY